MSLHNKCLHCIVPMVTYTSDSLYPFVMLCAPIFANFSYIYYYVDYMYWPPYYFCKVLAILVSH